MPRNASIVLNDHLADFVDEHEAKVAALRQVLEEGEKGPSARLTPMPSSSKCTANTSLMPTIDISDQARQDRDAIWRFSLGQWSDERADTYIVGLHAKLIAAAETPHRSPKVDIRPNCRKLLSGRITSTIDLSSAESEFCASFTSPWTWRSTR